MAKKQKATQDALATNKKARHDYTIGETFEAGMALTGTEIKSVRAGRVTIADGFVQIRHDEAWLDNVHISPFEQGNQFNHEPVHPRRLLLHKKEIQTLAAATDQQGKTIVPLKIYLKRGFAKVLIGIATGKHNYDKRHDLKKRDQERDIQRALRDR